MRFFRTHANQSYSPYFFDIATGESISLSSERFQIFLTQMLCVSDMSGSALLAQLRQIRTFGTLRRESYRLVIDTECRDQSGLLKQRPNLVSYTSAQFLVSFITHTKNTDSSHKLESFSLRTRILRPFVARRIKFVGWPHAYLLSGSLQAHRPNFARVRRYHSYIAM